MPSKECFHCGRNLEHDPAHDCWTTTEQALTEGLSEDLQEAWWRIRETATGFGEQRIYASHRSIMFARKHCYFFVRPNKNYLEVCFFLARQEKRPPIKKVYPSSKVKFAHLVLIRHRDEVESPLTDWLLEAYQVSELLRAAPTPKKKAIKKKTGPKTRRKKLRLTKKKPK